MTLTAEQIARKALDGAWGWLSPQQCEAVCENIVAALRERGYLFDAPQNLEGRTGAGSEPPSAAGKRRVGIEGAGADRRSDAGVPEPNDTPHSTSDAASALQLDIGQMLDDLGPQYILTADNGSFCITKVIEGRVTYEPATKVHMVKYPSLREALRAAVQEAEKP